MQRNLYTIGYEGSRLEDFVTTLQREGIQTLIDVRELPLSRKRGFSKSALASILEKHGIEYIHLKGLGDPKPGRQAARAGNFGLFRKIFGGHMETEVAQRDLVKAVDLVLDRPCCLMCFEHEHCNCHRSIVADHIAERTGITLRHISTRAVSPLHEQRIARPEFASA